MSLGLNCQMENLVAWPLTWGLPKTMVFAVTA